MGRSEVKDTPVKGWKEQSPAGGVEIGETHRTGGPFELPAGGGCCQAVGICSLFTAEGPDGEKLG